MRLICLKPCQIVSWEIGQTNQWEVAPCPFTQEKARIINKQGASRFHLSVLIAEASFPITSVTIQSAGRWFPARKTDYNFWEIPHQPVLANCFNVKVTCSNGYIFTVTDLDPSSTSPAKALDNC
ncbi:uncharacterized protein VP01_3677g2 [Puccinia sorghi]|uniref:Uncharacterized protein n=1 Tax=Puccinia sorghi TaxID=27349 RepID=A0A0L6UWA5_9BASI|nr:uncharacterized protein VP01_3677g2 [Puccinia sorghi]